MNDIKQDRGRGFMPDVFEFVWPLHFVMTNYVKCGRSLKLNLITSSIRWMSLKEILMAFDNNNIARKSDFYIGN
jgi:hypothetical protein